MIFTILSFSLLFIIKTILLTSYYNNNGIYLFPLELCSLVLSSKNILWSNYFTWIFLGWIGLPNELKYLNNIDDYNWYYILISWSICLFFYQIYYLIKYKNKINKWTFYNHNLKFYIVNYFPLYIWSLNRIINNSNKFVYAFINLLIFNAITFCLPSLIIYLLYGNKIITHRKRFSFLISNYKKKYKWYLLYEFLVKNITGTFLSFFYYWKIGNNYSLIFINLFYMLMNLKMKPFKMIFDFKFNLTFSFISLLIIIISEIELFFENNLFFLIAKITLIIIYFLLIISYNVNKKIKIKNNLNISQDVELIRN